MVKWLHLRGHLPGIWAGPVTALPSRSLWKEHLRRPGSFCTCAFESPKLPFEKSSDLGETVWSEREAQLAQGLS